MKHFETRYAAEKFAGLLSTEWVQRWTHGSSPEPIRAKMPLAAAPIVETRGEDGRWTV